jgi:hypothetical protein
MPAKFRFGKLRDKNLGTTCCAATDVIRGCHPAQPHHWAIYDRITDVFAHGTFRDVSLLNLWQGRSA